MKIVFLDIDGVANSEESLKHGHGGQIGIDPYMAFLIGKIQLATNCEFVLSSSWRHCKHNIEEINKRIGKIYDITPWNVEYTEEEKENEKKGIHIHRGKEIKAWLDMHPEVTKYAILDDDSDMLPEQLPNFFKTSWKTGITEEIQKQVIKHVS